jgi:hypothetical protein
VGIDRGGLRMIGATARMEPVGQFDFYSEFVREPWEATAVAGRPSGAAGGRADLDAIVDKNYDTAWQADPQGIDDAVLEFAFERPERLRQVVLFPSDVSRSPGSVAVEVSNDGVSWRAVFEGSEAVPMFWSVWHPHLKQVKPRMEIALPVAGPVRFCRLRFVGSRSRAGLGIREVLFLGDGPSIAPAEWEREIDDVVRAVREQGRGAVVVGDHWFANFFRNERFATDFISNEIVSDTGHPNPNLKAPVPLDFSRLQLLILQRAFAPGAEELLRGRGIPFRETPLGHHLLVLAGPAKVDRPLFWNGLELNELERRSH